MTSASPASQHLTPEVLAAFLERRLDSGARAEADLHLAGCERCRRDLAAAGRLLRRYRRRWRPVAAAAAVAAIALLVVLVRGATPGPDVTGAGGAVPDRYRSAVPRAVGIAPAAPALLSPQAGDTVAAGEPLAFRWRMDGVGRLHRVVLADEAGRTIWLTETPASEAVLPAEIILQPGGTYLWYVEAIGGDGERISSNPAALTVR